MVNIKLPSHGLDVGPVSSRCRVFLCRSVLIPEGGNETPVIKSTTKILSRSYDALRGSPVLVKLIRLGRIIFLQRTDSSWKKSRSHYVMTAYLRPLMLWGGAMLVCRALDPIVLPSEAS